MAYFYEQTIKDQLIRGIEMLAPKIGMGTDYEVLREMEYRDLKGLQDELIAQCQEKALTKNITTKQR